MQFRTLRVSLVTLHRRRATSRAPSGPLARAQVAGRRRVLSGKRCVGRALVGQTVLYRWPDGGVA